ncbi:MAG: type III-A CRISPR-associated protein Csm2 [Candidatus Latescibacterota bacterium]|nr:MAG: type III-A CRISPR-associated protein Csm2 [Candidatus Latescibacterota bacterium]RKY71621.1 MAG: type III-A CRISPR-associated protein Csm2 [Candidatus Latescibacterota bacterium]
MNARTSQQQRRNRGQGRRLPVPEEDIRRAIEGDPEALVNTAMVIGRSLAQRKLSTSQIRNIFGEVKRMQMRGFDPYKFQLLRPRLAYVVGRQTRSPVREAAQDLKRVLDVAIDKVLEEEERGKQKDRFSRFVDLFEAILAYYKERESELQQRRQER